MAAGDTKNALAAFREANRLVPAPRYRYNLATAEQATGHLVEAARTFRDFLADTSGVPEAYRKDAASQMAELGPHIGRLLVRGQPGTRVALDGEDVAVLPLVSPLIGAPGSHSLVVGRDTAHLQVALAAGRLTELELAPTQIPRALALTEKDASASSKSSSVFSGWWFWAAVAGVAAAGVVVAVIATAPGDARCSAGASCMHF